jgi:thioredoxin 1
MLKPILEKFAAEHIDTLRVVSLDVDKLPGVADSNRIRSVPTLMLFRDGKKIGRRIPGVVSPSELRVRVAALLAEK